MDELQRNLAAHFAAGGTLEQAANKHKAWDSSKGKDKMSMWQIGKSINEIENEMKRRSCRLSEGPAIKQSFRQQSQS